MTRSVSRDSLFPCSRQTNCPVIFGTATAVDQQKSAGRQCYQKTRSCPSWKPPSRAPNRYIGPGSSLFKCALALVPIVIQAVHRTGCSVHLEQRGTVRSGSPPCFGLFAASSVNEHRISGRAKGREKVGGQKEPQTARGTVFRPSQQRAIAAQIGQAICWPANDGRHYNCPSLLPLTMEKGVRRGYREGAMKNFLEGFGHRNNGATAQNATQLATDGG